MYSTKLLCSVSKIYQNLYKSSSVVSWFACNQRWKSIWQRPKRFFARKKNPETDLEEVRSKIDSLETKSMIKSTKGNKIPRFNLKLYTFVYDAMTDFPSSSFIYDTSNTNSIFRNVHSLIN